MTGLTRRTTLTAALGLAVAGCTGGPLRLLSGPEINQEVLSSRDLLFRTVPGTEGLAQRANGLLIIPNITEAGFVASAGYGEGALLIGNAVVDYISMSAAAFGLQIGAQQYAQALFFMTPESLAAFRQADGWEIGVDAEAVVIEEGVTLSASSNTINQPVYGVVYGQRGLIVGATLEGAKYSRLIR